MKEYHIGVYIMKQINLNKKHLGHLLNFNSVLWGIHTVKYAGACYPLPCLLGKH